MERTGIEPVTSGLQSRQGRGDVSRRSTTGGDQRPRAKSRLDDRDRVAAFDVEALAGGAGQAGFRVASVDPRLSDLEVEEEVEPTVAVDVFHVSLPVRLR